VAVPACAEGRTPATVHLNGLGRRVAILVLLPILSQPAIQGGVRDFFAYDPSLPQEPFSQEAQFLEAPAGCCISWIDVGYDTIWIQFIEAKLEQCGDRSKAGNFL
jgi:hypothetical protein